MVNIDAAEDVFTSIDRNRDGVIDRDEYRNAVTRPAIGVSTYEPVTVVSPRYREYVTERYSPYEQDSVINTTSREETRTYLERLAPGLNLETSAEVIRRGATENAITTEQRVMVRYLQPPPLPPPEPIIIQQEYDQPPAQQSTIRIREQARCVSTPEAALILRERPPVPPPRRPGQTITRIVPYPHRIVGRSVIIERFPPPPDRPRDIIIERWLPYGPECEQPTIVRPPIRIPQPPQSTCKIYVYDAAARRIVRKFENLGVVQEDPNAYLARYGSTLLDSATLLIRAREAGVVEDISLRVGMPSAGVPVRRSVIDYDQPVELIERTSSMGPPTYTSGGPLARTIVETRPVSYGQDIVTTQ